MFRCADRTIGCSSWFENQPFRRCPVFHYWMGVCHWKLGMSNITFMSIRLTRIVTFVVVRPILRIVCWVRTWRSPQRLWWMALKCVHIRASKPMSFLLVSSFKGFSSFHSNSSTSYKILLWGAICGIEPLIMIMRRFRSLESCWKIADNLLCGSDVKYVCFMLNVNPTNRSHTSDDMDRNVEKGRLLEAGMTH